MQIKISVKKLLITALLILSKSLIYAQDGLAGDQYSDTNPPLFGFQGLAILLVGLLIIYIVISIISLFASKNKK